MKELNKFRQFLNEGVTVADELEALKVSLKELIEDGEDETGRIADFLEEVEKFEEYMSIGF